MKILISVLNSKYIHASSAPWCLLAGVRAFGRAEYAAEVAESTVNADLDSFANELIAKGPDLLALSCYIWNVEQTLHVAQKAKNATGCTVVLGGPEAEFRAQDILSRYSFVDYVLGGEGEFAFPPFLDMLSGLRTPEEVAGLTYRDERGIVSNPVGVYTDTPPSPVSEEYLRALGGRICYIETSRGCPYRCAFCLSGRVSPLRFFDMEQVKRDLIKLAGSGSKTVKFVDRTFNAKVSHADEILAFILAHYGDDIPAGVCFHFEIAGDILKESTMALLARFPEGAVQLEIGMQSFNEDTLAALHRKTDTQRLQKNIRRLIEMGNMHIHIDLIAGLTGEDIHSFEQSFNIGYALGAHMLQLGFLKLLHGAPMREHPKDYPCTYSKEPPYEVTSTPWMTKEDLLLLKKAEDALERTCNSGRFLLTVDYLLRAVESNPFRLFCQIGKQVSGNRRAVGEYAAALYRYFAGRCEAEKLREALICDLIACGGWTQIPKELKRPHPAYGAVKRQLCRDGNVKLTILSDGTVFTADYDGARDLRGRLPVKIYSIDFDGESVYNIKEIQKEERI